MFLHPRTLDALDGGAVQEAYFFGKPCMIMRIQTRGGELVGLGAVGADSASTVASVDRRYVQKAEDRYQRYGGGQAAERTALYLSHK